MSGLSPSPFQRRLHQKLRAAGFKRSRQKDAATLQRAFVEALKEEVEKRYEDRGQPPPSAREDPTYWRPLVIPGLGSFKMKTRPKRGFPNVPGAPFTWKEPSRRLAFTSKWEPIDG